jgi:hypothetical protein
VDRSVSHPSAEEVVSQFIRAINAHDPQAVAGLLSPAHEFTDALGKKLTGVEALEEAWRGYFALFPDYHLEPDTILSAGQTVAVFGHAAGTYANAPTALQGSWRLPAAWRAVVIDGLLREWQVYADNRAVNEILAAFGDSSASGRPA